ncbi:MAG TPA: ABC transporter ATP-binding protein [Candidatus Limiplasma sp.]|nr:ABC transporter ATP-binding protein [Candidatus Limiplasma sp.]HPS80754.1 ABC transporter ATP-binding protein [Candidatus Limiplasma sp.]
MIRRLMKSIREYKKATILTPLYVSVEVVIDVIIPLLMARLIDSGITAGSMPMILQIGLALVISCVVSLAFGALSGKNAAVASAGFAHNLRQDMFDNVQSFSFANIDRFSSSSLITRLTTDVTNVQNAFQMVIRIAVRSPLMVLFSLVMAFRVNAELSLVFLCTVPLLAVGMFLIIHNAHPIFERVFKTYDKLNKVVQENLRGIRVVKSFVREDFEIEKFEKVSTSIYQDFSRAERLVSFSMPLMQAVMYVIILLLSWLGAKMIVGSTMTTGELMSLITYAGQILMSLMMLSMVFVMITISRASMERISEVLAEKSDIADVANPIMAVRDGSIRFRQVGFSYSKDPEHMCLKDIDLDIPSGAVVGILGETGSGKSSMVQLIPRLYDATMGAVEVGGVDVRAYDLTALRESVAMVLQKNELFAGTIKDNLRWGNEQATDDQLVHACRLAQADGFIRQFPDGYDTLIEQGGANVSGGQKQRLCIARALLKQPKILILDDSTSAVDTATDALIRKAFREEIPNTTKLLIAQRIASIQDADMIVVMDGGRVAEYGTHEGLLAKSDIYREVYESQTKGGDRE